MSAQLLLAKRLFLEASAYAEQDDPVSCGIAISLLQDAAELYVWALLKERNVAVKDQAGFVSNLDSLQRAGIVVPHVARLLELNKARVGFKHYGNLPAPDEAKKHRTHVEDFLRAAMLEHFAVSFDDLSLIELVSDGDVREQLKLADAKIGESKFSEAAGDLAKAKAMVFSRLQKYVPKIDSRVRDADRMLNAIDGVRNAAAFAYLVDYLAVLRESILVAMLRFPIEDYAFLQRNLPSASRSISGSWFLMSSNKIQYTEAECRRALSYIVALCVRMDTLA